MLDQPAREEYPVAGLLYRPAGKNTLSDQPGGINLLLGRNGLYGQFQPRSPLDASLEHSRIGSYTPTDAYHKPIPSQAHVTTLKSPLSYAYTQLTVYT
ncbi:hypothetical protein PGT21_021831 [Puccinia graminis f. sp. tritici]|uniref:Uncharacterized protein n=1 Tax=Puccinia graminis f. sp. tritici TaxID=56615 RepID=A0A5B0M289_PUCGR|nr:hypothetical protein PGT21_021831 [Puccinia graminis f. sp. tritici]KAA1125760.1 hypothetical protein PGTUg99_015643 [Puccinia graminis f. sp. tritici]